MAEAEPEKAAAAQPEEEPVAPAPGAQQGGESKKHAGGADGGIVMDRRQSSWLSAPLFLSYLAYVQAACAANLAVMPLGLAVTHGLVAQHVLSVVRTRWSTSKKSQLVLDDTKQPVVFLCNHRSWGDFIIDAALFYGASFIARRAVIAAVPVSALWGWLKGWLWLFDRRVKHAEGAVKWMESFIKASHKDYPNKGVVLYPEGTRTLLPQGLPPRPGGLAAAYNLGWPVQVIISTNKEHVLGERNLELGCGTRVNSCVSAPLWPKDYPTAEAFVQAAIAVWHETWTEAYSSNEYEVRPYAALPGIAAPWAGAQSRL